uniref:Uncharacterized protein n=1 Tax=Anguilla anguilla TaxID=7936 RepID=A0A0E9TKB5_ANGAN
MILFECFLVLNLFKSLKCNTTHTYNKLLLTF